MRVVRRILASLLLAAAGWAPGEATEGRIPQRPPDSLTVAGRAVISRQWEKAGEELEKAEREGLCHGAVCQALKALIENGRGNAVTALKFAQEAAALFGEEPRLRAWHYNELGVLFYRAARGDRRLLEQAVQAFRRADAVYERGASNIRFNLAVVLKELGRSEEAERLLAELESGTGLVVDPSMSILGDFRLGKRMD